MQHVLVTGAAGFIGFHLSQKLLENGIQVTGLDNLNDYYDPTLKQARLDRLTPNPSFTHTNIDLADRSAMEDLFSTHNFDAVVNLAAQAGVRYSLKNPDSATSYCPYRLYNIGNNQPMDLMQYIETLEKSLGKKAQKNFLPMQKGDIPATCANVDDLAKDVGFKPDTPIETGIAKFVEWYRGFYNV